MGQTKEEQQREQGKNDITTMYDSYFNMQQPMLQLTY